MADSSPSPAPDRRRLPRAVVVLLWCLAVPLTLIVAARASLLLPPVRNAIASTLSQQLSSSLQGRVDVKLTGGLGFSGVDGLEFEVYDSDNDELLLDVDDASAEWSVLNLLRSLMGDGPLLIQVPKLSIEHAMVDLTSDEAGLRLAQAFSPAQAAPPDESATGPAPVITLESVRIEDARVIYEPGEEKQTAHIHALDGQLTLGDGIFLELYHAGIEGSIPGLDASASLELSGRFTQNAEGEMAAVAEVTGKLGQLPLHVEVSLEDEQWSARGNVSGTADQFAEVVPGLTPQSRVEVAFLGLGDFEAGRFYATVTTPAGSRIAVFTRLQFDPLSGNGMLAVSDLNPRALLAAAPQGRIDARGRFAFEAPGDASLWLSVSESRLGEQSIPSLQLSARVRDAKELRFEVATTRGPRLEVDGQATRQGERIEFSVGAAAPGRLEPAWSEGTKLRSAFLDARGSYDPEREWLSADVRLDVARVQLDALEFSAREVHLDAHVEGALARPELRAEATIQSLRHPALRLSGLRMSIRRRGKGHRVELQTDLGLDPSTPKTPIAVDANTQLLSLSPVRLRGAQLRLRREGLSAAVSVDAVQVGDQVVVDGFRLTGIGRANGQLHVRGGDQQAALQVHDLRLNALAQLLAPLLPELSGRVTADVEARMNGGRLTRGHVYGRARGVQAGALEIELAAASLVVEDGRVFGGASIQHGSSWLRLDTRSAGVANAPVSQMPAQGLSVEALRGYFVVTMDVNAEDFSEALTELAPGLIVEGGVKGEVFVDKGAGALRAGWFVRTDGVGYASIPEATDADATDADAERGDAERGDAERGDAEGGDAQGGVASPEWVVRGLRADWTGSYGASPARASSSVHVRDEVGNPLAHLSFAIIVPTQALLSGRAEQILEAPVSGVLELAQMPLSAFPVGFIPSGIEADARGNVFIAGTMAEPELQGTLALDDFSMTTLQRSLPVNVRVEGRYGGSEVHGNAKVWYDERLVAKSQVDLQLQDGVRLSADARIQGIPLGCFPYVRDYGLAGSVSARVEYERTAERERLDAHVFGRDLMAASTAMPRLDVNAELREGELRAQAEMVQKDGKLSVEVAGHTGRGGIETASFDALALRAEEFQVRPLLMFVSEPVENVEGELDGRLTLDLNDQHASGELVFSKGQLHLPALGQGFSDIGLTLRAKPGKVLLESFHGQSGTGSFEGKGVATYGPRGRIAATAQLRIPKDDPIPISQQGLEVATASGRIDLNLARTPEKGLEVSIDLPRLRVEVDPSATRSVQSLEPAEAVVLGTVHEGRFIPLGVQEPEAEGPSGEPAAVTVRFGNDVWIERGAGTFVRLDGEVRALLAEELRLLGELRAEEGQINVLGRVFEVTQSMVSFRGQTPPNPDVVAEAAWTSPAGYTVFAGFQGSLKSGEMTLRSEPPLSYSQILNVLLFDDPQGGSGGESEGPGATGMAASVAGAGLGRALSKLTSLEISAGVDTTEEGTARPEVAVRISPRVAVGVSYNPDAAPSLGRTPDRAVVSLDWRVTSKWALESSFGDRGSASADLVWRFRY